MEKQKTHSLAEMTEEELRKMDSIELLHKYNEIFHERLGFMVCGDMDSMREQLIIALLNNKKVRKKEWFSYPEGTIV